MKLQLFVILFVSGWASVTMMDGSEGTVSDKSCNVRVYQTQAQALKQGPIEELCIITGDSSFSFVHTAIVAIKRHKSKACTCRGNAVSLESRSPPGGFQGPATVSMVAFRSHQRSAAEIYAYCSLFSRTRQSPQLPRKALTLLLRRCRNCKGGSILVDTGFPLIGNPVRFKQQGNRTFYEANRTGGHNRSSLRIWRVQAENHSRLRFPRF